jgi:hypothetical protein
MNVLDVLAAGLNLSFDYTIIKNEMLALQKYWKYTPPYKTHIDNGLKGLVFMSDTEENYNKIDYTNDSDNQHINRELRGQYIFYLRKHTDNPDNIEKFTYTKKLSTEGWEWVEEYRELMPYTIQCIESLPYKRIGCIRVFVTHNTFFPTHRDSGMLGPAALSKNHNTALGLSIIPDTGNVPMQIYSFDKKEVYRVHGNAMLFNDSAFHGVEFTPDTRITIRVFGDIDYTEFSKFIDPAKVFY